MVTTCPENVSNNGGKINMKVIVKAGDRVRYWDRQHRWWVRGSLVAMDDPQTAVVLLDSEFRKSSHTTGRVLIDLARLRPAGQRRSGR